MIDLPKNEWKKIQGKIPAAQTEEIKRLKEEVQKQKKIAKYNPAAAFKGVVTIVADQNMSFRLLSEVMYTAGQAEFSKFKFAVVKKGG